MDYEALWQELTTDPEGLGYADPNVKENDRANYDLINAPTRAQSRDAITPAELFAALDETEVTALKDGNLRMYEHMRQLDSIDVTAGSDSRAQLDGVFPPAGATGTKIAALVSDGGSLSRAQELGLGRVYLADLDTARKRYGGS